MILGLTPDVCVCSSLGTFQRIAAQAVPFIAAGLLRSDSGASWFAFNDTGLATLAAPMLSPGGDATLVQFYSTEGYKVTRRYTSFLVSLRAAAREAQHASGDSLIINDFGQLATSYDR